MPDTPIAPESPEVLPNQAELPNVEAEAPAEPEQTFTLTQARAMIDKSAKQAADKAVADYKAELAAEAEAPEEPEPPKAESKEQSAKLLLESQLEAERTARAELETKVAEQAADSLRAVTMDKIAALVAADPQRINDANAQREMVATIYAEGKFTMTDGELCHPDLTQQPSQIVTDFLSTRDWLRGKLPEGMGAAPASQSTPQNGTNGQSAVFDSSKFMDFMDAAEAAADWHRKHPKG